MDWEIVVGLEVHVQLNTRTKLFCGCPTAFGAAPNTQTCPICLGLPGSLPVINRAAFEKCLSIALAFGCEIPKVTAFDRKNYYYPDLPKNYQISQEFEPMGRDGSLEIDLGATPEGRKKVRIHNVHLEEDAGKLVHPEGGPGHYSVVDLNRAGTPLAEIVTEPDFRSVAEVEAYMATLRETLAYLDVTDGKMEEGSLRFEASVSLRHGGAKALGSRVEIKNLNSTKAVAKALEYERARQIALLESGRSVKQETRQWDEDDRLRWDEEVARDEVQALLPKDFRGKTQRMRGKEESKDYRYFPEPDLPAVALDPAWLETLRQALPPLPLAVRDRLVKDFGLSLYDAKLISEKRAWVAFFLRRP